MLCKLWELHHDFQQLDWRRSILFVELEHKFKNVAYVLVVLLSKTVDSLNDQFLSVVLGRLLVEPSHVIHHGKLVVEQPYRENIRLVDVVFGESRISIDNVSLPKDWRKVLGSSSDGCCLSDSTIVISFEQIF